MTTQTLFTDSQGRTWQALEREGGSISLYYTREGVSAHFVVWDSLDGVNNSGDAKDKIAHLTNCLEQAEEALERAKMSLEYWHKQATTKAESASS